MSGQQRLLRVFDLMEAERLQLLTHLDSVPEDRLAAVPSTGGWTVAQVITHLAMAEEGALAYLDKKLTVKKHGPIGFVSLRRLWFLNTALQLPVKYKAPAIVADVPATSYADARTRWDAVREAMRVRYSTLDDALARHDLYKHPMVGKLSALHGVRFMRQHARRHSGQIKRILSGS